MTAPTSAAPILLVALAVGALWGHDALVLRLVPFMDQGLAEILLRGAELLLAAAALWGVRRLPLAAWRVAQQAWDRLAERTWGRLPPARARLVESLLLTVGTGALLAGLGQGTVVFNGAERRISDAWFNAMFPVQSQAERMFDGMNHSKRVRDDIVILKIDNETVRRLGWPMQRKHYAQAIDAMTEAGAKSLVFDVVFTDENADHPQWDVMIGAAAKRNGRVIFGYPIVGHGGERLEKIQGLLDGLKEQHTLAAPTPPLPQYATMLGMDARPEPVIAAIAPHAMGLAATNVVLDAGDELLRHGTLAFQLADRLYPSLALRAVMHELNVPAEGVKLEPGGHLDVGGKLRVPVDGLGRVRVRLLGRFDEHASPTFPLVPFFHVLRRDISFSLPGNPLGEDLRLEVRPDTKIFLDDQPVSLDEVDPALIKEGVRVKGRTSTATDPARILELRVWSTPQEAEPAYEFVDESTLDFDDVISSLKVLRADPALFKDKHILVGSTATAASDLRNTPLGAVPGIEHHATLLNNLLNQDVLVESSPAANVFLVMLLAVLVGLMGAWLRPSLGTALAAVMMLGVLGGGYTLFTRGVVMPLVPPLGTLLLGHMLCMVQGFRREQQEKARAEEGREFIRATFGRYLTDQVVETLLEHPDGLKLGGDRRNVTIMMTDLRGFTSMSAVLEPEKVVSILNNYLGIMTDIVVKYGGTIDEFIGDAILVVFGAPVQKPDDAVRCVACAIEMLTAMDKVNAWNVANNLPPVAMGIGINTGEVVVGNIGSEKRAKYGIVGSPINMCARVESYTVGGQLLISENTRNSCGDLLVTRDQMSVQAKGISQPITLFEVIGVKPPYNVHLPLAQEELRLLPTPLRITYTVLAGKHAGADLYEAKIRLLSAEGMEAELGKELESLSNLKLTVYDNDGNAVPGDLYGKVTQPSVGDGRSYVRFTSVPKEIEAFLKKVHEEAKGEEQASGVVQ